MTDADRMPKTVEEAVEYMRDGRQEEVLADLDEVRQALRDGVEAAAKLVVQDETDTTHVAYLRTLLHAQGRIENVDHVIRQRTFFEERDEAFARSFLEEVGERASNGEGVPA